MFRNVIGHTCKQLKQISGYRFVSTDITEIERIEKTINQVTLLGRVGANPQMRGTTEHPVVIFSLATHSNYKYGTGEIMQRTDWHKVCVFKPKLRDIAHEYVKKGQRLMVMGKLNYSEIKDASGQNRSTMSIIADDIIFLHTQ